MDERVVHMFLSLDEELYIGKLYAQNHNGKQIYSIELSDEFIKSDYGKFKIDPEIEMYSGRQYLTSNKLIFGFLSDSCPDRWGRLLIRRKEMEEAKKENRKPKNLMEVDYLLNVYDESRMGALRFKLDYNGPFLANEKKQSVPPWVYLRTLEEYSLKFDNDEELNDSWIKNLLIPGSSLGGARPKCSVYSNNDELWIAKFPSKKDTYDVGAWEAVMNELALICNLNVPEFKLEKFSKYGSTFLSKRFDRKDGKRIHTISFMTLLNANDGESSNYSYIDLASYLKSNSYNPKSDLIELWKRLVFNMAISNTDDHLRNHSVILENKKIQLAPLYDVNPNPYGERLSLNIDNDDNLIDTSLLFNTYKYYNLTKEEAIYFYNDIVRKVNENWETIAKKYNINNNSINFMRPAFNLKLL